MYGLIILFKFSNNLNTSEEKAFLGKHKVSYQNLTRNPSKADGFEVSNYGALMDTYTELMAKKRNGSKKGKMSKELSQSFHMGQQKKSSEHITVQHRHNPTDGT